MLPWHRSLLDELRVAHLATIAPDGRPHLVPVCYALVADRIVISVDEKPKRGTNLQRLRNIERDPRVTLLADRYDDDWQRLAWLRIDGQASILAQGSQLPAALTALRARYPQYRAMSLETLPLILIDAGHIASWRWPS